MENLSFNMEKLELDNTGDIRNQLTQIVGTDYIKENNFDLNFKLPPVLIESEYMTTYKVPYAPHIFNCNEVVLFDYHGNKIENLNNMNVLCMHGINDGISHLSTQNPDISIQEIIQKAENKMKGNKIDVIAVCNKNSGLMEFYSKNEYRRIYALNSEVGVTLKKLNQTGYISIELSLKEPNGEFTNIEKMKAEEIVRDATFERK